MKDFRDLEVWQVAHEMALMIYAMTRRFPDYERYGITSQLRRSAVSVASNIAEGRGRRTDAEFARFLHIAMGSLSELDYQVLLARDLAYITTAQLTEMDAQIESVRRMLWALCRRLE
jgi:four helix bundle protein